MLVSKAILYGFMLAIAAVLCLGVYVFFSIDRLNELDAANDRLKELATSSVALEALVFEADKNRLAWQLTGQRTYHDRYQLLEDQLTRAFDSLRSGSLPHPRLSSIVDELQPLLADYLSQAGDTLTNAADSTGLADPGLSPAIVSLLNRYQQQCASTVTEQQATLDNQFYRFAFLSSSILVVAVVIIAGLLYSLNSSEKQKAEALQTLRRSNELVTGLYENAPCGYLTVNEEAIITNCNHTLAAMLGYSKAQIIDRLHIEQVLPSWQAVLQNRAAAEAEEPELITRTGSRLVALVTVSEVPAANGAGREYRLTMVDYTDRQHYKNQLRQNIEDLEAFSYSVSHDLKAPLRAISNYSALFREDYHQVIPDEGLKLVDTVMKNAVDMNRLIDDLLRLSRTGRQDVIKTEVDMEAMVTNMVNTELAQTNNDRVAVSIGKLGAVWADIGLMRQVWLNIIRNAIKFSAMAEQPTLEIDGYDEGSERVFFVKDNGVGFDMAYYDKLFKVFQRLHSKKDFDGTGVGLALTKRIVENHGGRIWATSSPGAGTTFFFTLPLGAS